MPPADSQRSTADFIHGAITAHAGYLTDQIDNDPTSFALLQVVVASLGSQFAQRSQVNA
jgi:hypothetical protein